MMQLNAELLSIEVKSNGSSPKLLSTTLCPSQNNQSFQTWSNYSGYDGYDTVKVSINESSGYTFRFGDYGPQIKFNSFGLAPTDSWYGIGFSNDSGVPCCTNLELWFNDVSSSSSVTIHYCHFNSDKLGTTYTSKTFTKSGGDTQTIENILLPSFVFFQFNNCKIGGGAWSSGLSPTTIYDDYSSIRLDFVPWYGRYQFRS